MNEERKFLHDIANPLGTIFFLIDTLLGDLSASASTADLKLIEQLEIVSMNLDKMKKMVESRRDHLKRKS